MAAASETSFASEVAEDLLVCAICHSRFQEPKVLSCQHSFCANCLKEWLQSRKVKTNLIKCAVCRYMTDLPSRGVDGLPENFALKGMLSIMKRREVGAPSAKTKGLVVTVGKNSDVNSNVAGDGKIELDDACRADSMRKKFFENSVSSQQLGDECSGESTDDDGTSSSDDCSGDSDVDSGSLDESSSCSDSSAPNTPTLLNFGDIKIGMKVYIFDRRGKRYRGRVKLLESCHIVGAAEPRTYAGVELTRYYRAPKTEDLHLMDDSCYLATWMDDFNHPSTVVRADECIPAFIVDQLTSQ